MIETKLTNWTNALVDSFVCWNVLTDCPLFTYISFAIWRHFLRTYTSFDLISRIWFFKSVTKQQHTVLMESQYTDQSVWYGPSNCSDKAILRTEYESMHTILLFIFATPCTKFSSQGYYIFMYVYLWLSNVAEIEKRCILGGRARRQLWHGRCWRRCVHQRVKHLCVGASLTLSLMTQAFSRAYTIHILQTVFSHVACEVFVCVGCLRAHCRVNGTLEPKMWYATILYTFFLVFSVT